MRKSVIAWIDERYPLTKNLKKYFSEYYVPRNLNIWYVFGALLLFVFISQFISGLWLTMFYIPTTAQAFSSIQHIMREVNYGWFIRYLHTTGASFFFILIYLHLFRGLLYGSYKKPRELVWLVGMLLLIALIAEAFFGYLLPWGQMSYWGAQVITSLVSAIPWIGDNLVIWLRGDYHVGDVTLRRFFALHVIFLPLLMIFLIKIHIIFLRSVGSNNPQGFEPTNIEPEKLIQKYRIPFHPYYTIKDLLGLCVFLVVFFAVIFFAPMGGGYFIEHENLLQANALVTPREITPLWYMMPFYAILRAIPNKLMGIMALGGSLALLFVLPWLDRSTVRSIRYRGLYSKLFLVIFALSFISLGVVGSLPVTPVRLLVARISTFAYFLFFMTMPFYTKYETCKKLPEESEQQ